jgi:hypothetical protein
MSLLLNSMLFGTKLTVLPFVCNYKFSFSGLTAVLLFRNQFNIFCNSMLTLLDRVERWESVTILVASSAKKKVESSVESGR